jgi:hypothetical protein
VSSTAHHMNIFIGKSEPHFPSLVGSLVKVSANVLPKRSLFGHGISYPAPAPFPLVCLNRYGENRLTSIDSWHDSRGRWCRYCGADRPCRHLRTGPDSQTWQIRCSSCLYHYSVLSICPLGTVDRRTRWLEILWRPRWCMERNWVLWYPVLLLPTSSPELSRSQPKRDHR